MFGGLITEKIAEQIISKPDVPIALLICLLVISGLFYLLMKSYNRNDKLATSLESISNSLSTIIQLTNIDHEATIKNRDILQNLDVCVSNNKLAIENTNTQIGNVLSEIRSHKEDCIRKVCPK